METGDVAADRLQPGLQARRGVVGADGDFLGKDHRSGIQALLHAHDGDAGDLIAGQQRTLDRGGTAPARQERGMDVEAAQPRHAQQSFGQDQAVGHHHQRIDIQ